MEQNQNKNIVQIKDEEYQKLDKKLGLVMKWNVIYL